MSNPKEFTFIVNGRPRTVAAHKQAYVDIVKLAFPDAQFAENIAYTVTFSFPKGGHDGVMVEGDTQVIKEGMVFNVTRTDKS